MDIDIIRDQLSASEFNTGNSAANEMMRGDHDLNPEFLLDDNSSISDDTLRPAAVMVGLVDRPDGLHVLLTRRTENLEHHPGQISFPGGHIDKVDADASHAALRETFEETGIESKHISIIGSLDTYITRTGFSITPIIGFISTPFKLIADPIEVAEIFEVPLAHFMNPANHQLHERTFEGAIRKFYAMPYGDYYIWGATAGMLFNLYEVLKVPSKDA
ncbi:MAG: CoA pyrophosphatase [Rhodospirillaceae bacterium]|nr:CoA pyrophosphatase [Rhodospirillaceae bacterium]